MFVSRLALFICYMVNLINMIGYPYKECEDCKGLGDCPYVIVLVDGVGTPVEPDDCPKKPKE